MDFSNLTDQDIQRLVNRERKRKAYAKAYRERPGVKDAYKARSSTRRASLKADAAWARAHRESPEHKNCPIVKASNQKA